MIRLAIAMALVAVAGSPAQDSLESVRELYASADYESALSTLQRLKNSAGTADTVEIEKFRVLCLFALGRTAEAEQAIEELLATEPWYSLSAADAPPRIRTAFSAVRRRVLPGLVRALYAEGKAAYDRKAWPEAVQKLERTQQLLGDPDAALPDLTDLRTVTSAFLELSRLASSEARPAPTVEQASRPAEEPPPAPAPTAAGMSSDPVALRQAIPPWRGVGPQRGRSPSEFQGSIDVDIDERGVVVGALISKSIHPSYDPVLVQAARTWLYEPARRDGQPVKARKRVTILLRSR